MKIVNCRSRGLIVRTRKTRKTREMKDKITIGMASTIIWQRCSEGKKCSISHLRPTSSYLSLYITFIYSALSFPRSHPPSPFYVSAYIKNTIFFTHPRKGWLSMHHLPFTIQFRDHTHLFAPLQKRKAYLLYTASEGDALLSLSLSSSTLPASSPSQ